MNVNVKYLKLFVTQHNTINAQHRRVSVEFKFKTDSHDKRYPHLFYISGRGTVDSPPIALENAFDCMRGNASFNPFHDDGLYLIKFGSTGFRYHFSDGSNKDIWVTFPMELIADKIRGLMGKISLQNDWDDTSYSNDRFTLEYEFDERELNQIRRKVAPCYTWNQEEKSRQCLREVYTDSRVKNIDRFRDGIKHLVDMAKSYSNGIPVNVYLSNDHVKRESCPMSFYFCITNHEGKRIINGGIIAHKRGDNEFEYSMHT